MASGTIDLAKREHAIRTMFAGVAPRYDLLNHLLSGGLDLLWRRRAAGALNLPAGSLVLDVCCGTGDQALALARRGYRVAAADFCLPMLALARGKYGDRNRPPAGLAGNALGLPFASGAFAGVTAAFGLRNVERLEEALAELARVLEPGGRAALLEFAVPESRLLRAPYLFYFRRILPRLGRLVSADGDAYSYLPASVMEFPQRDEFTRLMTEAGFEDAGWRDLAGGAVCLYLGRRG